MQSTHSREQDFMAITAEIEILSQRLKLKGMYSVPSPQPSTAEVQPNHNVHFQPINLAPKFLMQAPNFQPVAKLGGWLTSTTILQQQQLHTVWTVNPTRINPVK